jgi:hypothetical protein
MSKKKQKNDDSGIDHAGLTPAELKTGETQREINLSNKEEAKQKLRNQGHKVPRTEDALTNLSVKDRNLLGKEEAKAALRAEGHEVPQTPGATAKRTQRERNLAFKDAAKQALKDEQA